MGSGVNKLLNLNALPEGEISIGDINEALETTGERSLGQSDGRQLAGVPSGQISLSDYQGKEGNETFVITAGEGDFQGIGTITGYDDGTFDNEILGSASGTIGNTNINSFLDIRLIFNGQVIFYSCFIILEGNVLNDLIGGIITLNNKTYNLIAEGSGDIPSGYLEVALSEDEQFTTMSNTRGNSNFEGFDLVSGQSYNGSFEI